MAATSSADVTERVDTSEQASNVATSSGANVTESVDTSAPAHICNFDNGKSANVAVTTTCDGKSPASVVEPEHTSANKAAPSSADVTERVDTSEQAPNVNVTD